MLYGVSLQKQYNVNELFRQPIPLLGHLNYTYNPRSIAAVISINNIKRGRAA